MDAKGAFSLRQHGTCYLYAQGRPVFALAERKNETQEEMKYRLNF
jgi:hypothetical protein